MKRIEISYNSNLKELEKLNKTKYGKCIPVNPKTFKPLYGYTPSDIRSAKDTVNEFARLGRFVKRLEAMGYFSKW